MVTSLSRSRSTPDPARARWCGAAAVALASIAASALFATSATAHGFGQRYDLPIPLSFYLFGTAATVVVSFVIVGLFVRKTARSHARRRVDLLAFPLGRWIAGPSFALALQACVLAV